MAPAPEGAARLEADLADAQRLVRHTDALCVALLLGFVALQAAAFLVLGLLLADQAAMARAPVALFASVWLGASFALASVAHVLKRVHRHAARTARRAALVLGGHDALASVALPGLDLLHDLAARPRVWQRFRSAARFETTQPTCVACGLVLVAASLCLLAPAWLLLTRSIQV